MRCRLAYLHLMIVDLFSCTNDEPENLIKRVVTLAVMNISSVATAQTYFKYNDNTSTFYCLSAVKNVIFYTAH